VTSDAKIGLLLGLVFIVVIAFLINGLPNFFHPKSSDDGLTTTISQLNSGTMGLKEQAIKVVAVVNHISEPPDTRQEPIVPAEENYQDVRFTTSFAAKEKVKIEPKMRNIPPQPSTYVVTPGDNLGVIAIKVYGQQRGNKKTAVDTIYHANRQTLSSPDEVLVGQKLNIPSLSAVSVQKDTKQNVFVQALNNLKDMVNTTRAEEYVVENGDSLWQIAEKCLGNGSRYHDIVDLNIAVIDDVQNLPVGLPLKLPKK